MTTDDETHARTHRLPSDVDEPCPLVSARLSEIYRGEERGREGVREVKVKAKAQRERRRDSFMVVLGARVPQRPREPTSSEALLARWGWVSL